MNKNIYAVILAVVFLVAACKLPPSMKEYKAYMQLAQKSKTAKEKIRYYETALSAWRKGMPISAKADAYCGIAIALRQKGDYKNSLRFVNIALKITPEKHQFYNERALIYYNLELLEKAHKDVEKSLSINPNFTPAFYTRGSIYFKEKKYQKSLTDFNRVIKLEPDFTPVYLTRAKIYIALKQDEKAVKDLSKVISKNKNNPDAYFERGTAYGNTDNYEKAIKDLNKAISLDPEKVEAYLYKGIFYFVQGQYSFAIDSFNKMLILDKDYITAYIYRGFAFLEMGNTKLAKDNFESVRNRDIDNTEAAMGMALLSYYGGDKNNAVYFYDKALRLNPEYNQQIKTLISKKEFFYLRHHAKALEYLNELRKEVALS